MIAQKKNLQSFGISESEIKHNLEDYYKKITPAVWGNLKNKFESIEIYVKILYYFRFVEKLTASEIANKLDVDRVSRKYTVLGWDFRYTGSFEEVCQNSKNHYLNTKSLVETRLTEMEKDLSFPKEFKEYLRGLKDYKKQRFHRSMGFESMEKCLETMYYLMKKTDLSTSHIAIYYNVNIDTLGKNLRTFGLCRDLETANIIANIHDLKNYPEMFRNARLMSLRQIDETGLFGTKLENYCRSYLSTILPKYIDEKRYETIVGINHPCIVKLKEIDIPVIIIDSFRNSVYKFSVEFNGMRFHEDDNLKRKTLEEKGWLYIPILYHTMSSKIQKKLGSIEEQCDECGKFIQDFLKDK